ncbi:MAG: anti-sigma factor [Rhodovulum sulfidophilum]|uniref:Anti-sigma factor n=1 Tax=Rhodovulum sulfidophilum TaxID=35806 RepID=A0A2W5PYJ5_RHOSU|nr:MAG: anti-sigma factor [Rhodovulum sulfidophilum]
MRHGDDAAIAEADIAAYVDGQLDEWRRSRVEAHLAAHPEAAARVMRDLCLQRELRLALGAGTDAGRARHRMPSRAMPRAARRLAPAAALAGCAWLAWTGVLPLPVSGVSASVRSPEFVAAAIAAREASGIRLPMRSITEDPHLDAEELRAMTGILLPAFDPSWTILDAQVFPSPRGPGVEVVFDTPDMGRVTHFAVRAGGFAITSPQTVPSGDISLAWFQIGETAHVLIADHGAADQIMAAAGNLTDQFHR